jgi:PAS domain S-box-containing protein
MPKYRDILGLAKPWHLVLLSVLLSELVTSVMSVLLKGGVVYDYMVVGAVVPLIVAPVAIYFLLAARKQSEERLGEYTLKLESYAAELMDAEEKLRLYSRALEEAPDGIQIVDPDGFVVYSNRAVEDIYGFPREELMGRHVNEMNADPEFAGREVIPTIRATGSWEGEIMVRHKDGREFPVWLTTSMVKNEGDEPVAMVGVMRDVTERKKAEAVLKESEEHLKDLLDSINAGIMIIEMDTHTIVDVNTLAADLIGLRKERIVGSTCHKFVCPSEVGMCPITDLDESVDNSERKLVKADGRTIPILKSAVPIKREGKDYLVESFIDITGLKRSEEALSHRVDMEKVISSISSRFIKPVSKDFDSYVSVSLKEIGEFEGMDRSYLFMFSEDGRTMDNTHEWCAEGVEPQIENLKGLTVEHFPWWMEKLRKFENIHVPIVADLPPEAGAEREILQAQGIQSLIVVPLISAVGLIGFLGLDSVRGERAWEKEDIRLLKLIGEIFVNAIERKGAIEQIRTSLEEKEALLHEIHHRVKNNMQIIFSLLRLQSKYVRNEDALKLFTDSQNRIRTMALVHEGLYLSEDLSIIDFRAYISKLLNNLAVFHDTAKSGISLNAEVEELSLGMETAIPCGLIINELVTNSLRYAFPDGSRGEVLVALRRVEEENLELVVMDNGVGLPGGQDYKNAGSMGLQLVASLAESQLGGTLELDTNEGTEFRIRFRELKYRERI